MAAESSDGLGGPAGTRWRNMTDDIWYQLVSSLRKPCAACLRRHARISPRPGESRSTRIASASSSKSFPGAQAPIEFRSAGELAAAMPVGGQVELVGALNWLTRSAGLVTWDDLFDEGGYPRDFDLVVRRKGLKADQLVAAGIAEGVARRAVGLGPLGK